MKIRYKISAFFTIVALAVSFLSLSCNLKDPDNYKIMIIVMGSGSTTSTNTDFNKFSATILLDDKPPLTFASMPATNGAGVNTWLLIPAGKITTATITATRTNSDSTLTILVYKDNELDEKGVGLLSTCNVTSTTSCSNTLNLIYKVDSEDTDKTKSASASSTKTTTTTTTP